MCINLPINSNKTQNLAGRFYRTRTLNTLHITIQASLSKLKEKKELDYIAINT